MKLRTVLNRIIVKRDKHDWGGVVEVAPSYDRQTGRGRVVAAGPGVHGVDDEWIPNPVKPGMVIYFQEYAGTPILVDGEEYTLLDYKDWLGVIEERD